MRVADAFRSTWEAFNMIIPHTLWTLTINFLTSG
jgi:hypothetical protein